MNVGGADGLRRAAGVDGRVRALVVGADRSAEGVRAGHLPGAGRVLVRVVDRRVRVAVGVLMVGD